MEVFTEDHCTMPKQKTKKGAVKRFHKTASGKITYRKAATGHLMSSKSSNRKRHLGRKGVLSKAETDKITPMLG